MNTIGNESLDSIGNMDLIEAASEGKFGNGVAPENS